MLEMASTCWNNGEYSRILDIHPRPCGNEAQQLLEPASTCWNSGESSRNSVMTLQSRFDEPQHMLEAASICWNMVEHSGRSVISPEALALMNSGFCWKQPANSGTLWNILEGWSFPWIQPKVHTVYYSKGSPAYAGASQHLLEQWRIFWKVGQYPRSPCVNGLWLLLESTSICWNIVECSRNSVIHQARAVPGLRISNIMRPLSSRELRAN